MLKRDFLTAQINKFTETVARALLALEKYNLVEVEETIRQNATSGLLDEFEETGQLPEDKLEYENLLFQLELLFVQLKLQKAKRQPINEAEKYLRIAKLLQSRQKDFNLNLQSRINEVAAGY